LLPWFVTDLEHIWEAGGATTVALETLVDPIENETIKVDPAKEYTYLKVSYEGRAESGERRLGKEVAYPNISEAKADDTVVSNIRAVDKAICVVPAALAGHLISPEFTILRLKKDAPADPRVSLECPLLGGNRGGVAYQLIRPSPLSR
jgi:hypothetical protein